MKTFNIYTKDGCGYCVKAKKLLADKGHKYNEFQVGKEQIQNAVNAVTEGVVVRTVPQIFLVNGPGQLDTYIGGYDQLANKIDTL